MTDTRVLAEKVDALIEEAARLPNPNRNLLTHNERVLIEFCQRLAAALKELKEKS